MNKRCFAAFAVLFSTVAQGSVIVLGNGRTGAVVVEGNAPGGNEIDLAVARAEGGADAGWVQIYGPDDEQRGWATVLCVRHKQGFFFAEAIGETSEAEAERTVNLKADRFLARLVGGENAGMIEKSATWPEMARQAAASGIGEKIKCLPAWNNQGQQISYRGELPGSAPTTTEETTVAPKSAPEEQAAAGPIKSPPPAVGDEPAKEARSDSQAASPAMPKRDYEAEYQAKLRIFEQQQAEHRRQVEEHEQALQQVEARKLAQRQQAQGAIADYQRRLADHEAKVAAITEENRRRQVASGQAGQQTGIADSFKVQNDAEWERVSAGLPEPREIDGALWAYCYQPSLVDSRLYFTELFNPQKQKTELELTFADDVARITRIGSGMSTHCHISTDPMYLDRLRANVDKVHSNLTKYKLLSPK